MREEEWWRAEGSWSVEFIQGFWGFASSRGRVGKGMLGVKTGNEASAGAPSRVGSAGRKFMGSVEIRERGKGQEGRETGWKGEREALL